MIGSLLVTFNETPDNRGGSSFNVLVNNINRDTHFTDVNDYYSTRLSVGDVVRFTANFTNDLYSEISVIRKDFTTDDEQGDKGIKQTNIDYDVIIQSFSSYVIQFTATTITSAYDFYYVVNVNTTTPTCFSIGSGFNNKTWQSKIQFDGKIVVGGDFTQYNNVSVRNRIIRLNSNGTIDFTFTVGTGPNNRVKVVTLETPNDNSSKIFIGGDFTTYSGVSRNRISKLNTNGTLDTGFTVGTGFNNTLNEITVQSDGKILCGGEFTSYSDTSINRIIRLNTDGTIDTSFNVGTGANLDVNNIKQQSDGKILVGGSLTTYNGTGVGRFVRLNSDGSIDSSFSGLTTGFDDTIYNITIYSDGKILVSGFFEIYNGVTRRRIVRLNSDGSFDSSFTPLSDANGFIYGQAIQSDGKIIIVGNFTTVNGQSRSGIARLNSDGTLDSTYNVGSGFVITDIIEDVQLTSDGKAIITGGFTSYNGTPANRIIRLNTDGSEDTCNFPVTPTPTPTVSVTPSNTPTPSITPSLNVSPTPTPSITPTLTQTSTPSPTPTTNPTPTPTITQTAAGLHTLVMWYKTQNVNTSGGLFSNNIFDYYVSWDYSGITGQTTMFTTSQIPSTYPTTVNIGTFLLPPYLNNASGVTFTVSRKLCGARPTGQVLTFNRDYIVGSPYSSYPATWGAYINGSASGCIKTCYSIYNNMIGTFLPRNLRFSTYLHILVEDKVGNTSC